MEYESQFEKLFIGFKDVGLSNGDATIYADGAATNMTNILSGTKPKVIKTKILPNPVDVEVLSCYYAKNYARTTT